MSQSSYKFKSKPVSDTSKKRSVMSIKPGTEDIDQQAPESVEIIPPEEPEETNEPIGPTEQALAHLRKTKNAIVTMYAGKSGHNPFEYIKQKIRPLEDRVKAGDQEAIKEAMELEASELNCSLKALGIEMAEDKGLKLKTTG